MATYSSIDLTGLFDDIELSSNTIKSSLDITALFDDIGPSTTPTKASLDITALFDDIGLSLDNPQRTKLLPEFEVDPVVDVDSEIINEGESEPPLPVAAFIPSEIYGAIPFSVDFANISTGTITEIRWYFGDGNTSTETNPTHVYPNLGTYTVYLRIFGGPYYSETTAIITALEPIVANFTSDITTGTAPLTVQFSDTSVGTPISWLWDFGDGNFSSDQNPEHTYVVGGSYDVSLTVETAYLSSTLTIPDYMVIANAFYADFTSNIQTGFLPLIVNFTDESVGSIVSWLWNFGDGNYSTEQNPQHIYYGAGFYTVGLRIYNGYSYETQIKYQYIHVLSGNVVAVSFDSSVPENNIMVRTMLAREPANILLMRAGVKVFEIRGQDDTLPAGFRRPQGPSILFD